MASEDLASRLVGGVLLAVGVLVMLLGGLCTGWLVVPEVTRSLNYQGPLRTLNDLWPFVAGAAATLAIGGLLALAGLRILRGHVIREADDDRGSGEQR